MKILLIQPDFGPGLGFQYTALVEPLGLEMVAAALLNQGHEVEILDLRLEKYLERALKKFNPSLCGISCSFTIDVYQTLRIAETIKKIKRGIWVVVGGHHASLTPTDLYCSDIDLVVIGEGELTAKELVAALEKGEDVQKVPGLAINTKKEQVLTKARPRIKDLDNLPLPARHLLEKYAGRYYLGFQKPLRAVETSRGCPYRCEFCSVWNFHAGECHWKSPERVVAEVSALKEKYVLFTDDNFLQSISRAEKMAKLLMAKGIYKHITIQARSDAIVAHPEVISLWRKVGLWKIFIGFEKIIDQELWALGKKNSVRNNEQALRILRSQGIEVCASFIIDPQYERKDFESLRHYIQKWKLYSPSLTIFTPLPGTDLFRRMKEKLTTQNLELFDFVHAVLPTKLNLQEFYKEFASLYKIGYLNITLGWEGLMAIWKWALRLGSFSQLWKMVKTARVMLNKNYYLAGHGKPLPSPPTYPR